MDCRIETEPLGNPVQRRARDCPDTLGPVLEEQRLEEEFDTSDVSSIRHSRTLAAEQRQISVKLALVVPHEFHEPIQRLATFARVNLLHLPLPCEELGWKVCESRLNHRC